MNYLKEFWNEEDGIGVVEIILIIVVIIGIVIIFRDQLKALVEKIFKTINDRSAGV